MGTEIQEYERKLYVEKAHNAIDAAVTKSVSKHLQLSYMEMVGILNQITSSWIKLAIQD